MGHYDDSEDVYWELLTTMLTTQDNFIAPQAHLLFWFSMKYYERTRRLLTDAGWVVNPMPFIWLKSDNTGILPDPARGPRNICETALFATRGDRKIVKPVANAIAAPTSRVYHSAEKPAPMLAHFFRMLVDEYSVVLDPTCGSGMAIRVAEEAGASYALGLEKDPAFYEGAKENLKIYED